jgi:peptide/nickel transport system substrate-binding protein
MTISKRSKVAAIVVGLALVAGACSSDKKAADSTTPGSGATADSSAPAAAGGEAILATEEAAFAYNNGTSTNSNFSNTEVINMVQPGPYIVDESLNYVLWKDLMDSVEVTSTSPQTVVYKINPKAVWSDGVAIDCKDFYLAYMAQNGKVSIPNPDFTGPGATDKDGNALPETLPVFDAASNTGYDQLKSVTCADDNKTVTAVFDTPFADWKGLFGGLVPAHIVEEKTGVADITKVDATAASPEIEKIGTFWNTGFDGFDPAIALSGAWYKVDSYTPDKNVVLVRNDKFWGTPANLDTLTIQFITDATAQAAALQNGEIQAMQPQADPGIAATLKAATGVNFAPASGLVFEHYDLNAKNPIFADKAVRSAFAACVDRQDIIDKLVAPVNPDAKPLNSVIFMPQQNGYADRFSKTATFDVAASKKLLEGAGWALGSDGFYAKDGKQLTFKISHKGIQRRSDTVQNTIASCKEAGFNIVEDSDTKFNAERLPAGDFDVALFAWVGTPTFSAGQPIYSIDGGSNFQLYANQKVTDQFKVANAELDEAKRLDELKAIDQAILDDVWTIPLFQLPDMPAWSKNLTGPVYNSVSGLTWNSNVWSLK